MTENIPHIEAPYNQSDEDERLHSPQPHAASQCPQVNIDNVQSPNASAPTEAAISSPSSDQQTKAAYQHTYLPQTYSTVFKDSPTPYPVIQHQPDELPTSYSTAVGVDNTLNSAYPQTASGPSGAPYPPQQTFPQSGSSAPVSTYPIPSNAKLQPESRYQYADPPPMYTYEANSGAGTASTYPGTTSYPTQTPYPGANDESRMTSTVQMTREEAERLGYAYQCPQRPPGAI
eukprot:CFRG2500T1